MLLIHRKDLWISQFFLSGVKFTGKHSRLFLVRRLVLVEMGFGVELGYEVEALLPSSVILGEDLTLNQFPLLQREADTYPTMK